MKRIQMIFLLAIAVLQGVMCFAKESTPPDENIILTGKNYDLQLNPSTFTLIVKNKNGKVAHASYSDERMTVADLTSKDNVVRWSYPKQDIQVHVALTNDYVDIDITSSRVNTFSWPHISKGVTAYTLPWHQGKFIPADNARWIDFWNYMGEINGAQELSMQFIGINYKDFALVFVIKNMFNNEFALSGKDRLQLKCTHEFPATVKDKKYGFRIYMSPNDPTSIAKTYKNYVQSQGNFITLEKKAETNPDIRKLYGAPFIYLWGNQFVVKENITDWPAFVKCLNQDLNSSRPTIAKHILNLITDKETKSGLITALKEVEETNAVPKYVRNVVIHGINDALTSWRFYDSKLWNISRIDAELQKFAKKGTANLSQLELYTLNKHLFYTSFKQFVSEPSTWGNGTSQFMLDQLHEMNIEKAWLGLESFQPAFMHPDFLKKANDRGYLVAVYDSYHSIHEPGKEQWETAKFTDTMLFENATVINKEGKFNRGFQGIGRKLNPLLSMPAVKERMNGLLNNGFEFNSWFIDCDATGEVFDDYMPARMTSQAQDVGARLERMSWIRDEKGMVIGSEGGNDFAASTIAYAHGLCSPVLPWQDLDWRKNKESRFYFGPYFSPDGGVPVQFAKQVPIKSLYDYVYYDYRFNLPLFQLVYNNSVIPSHHWGMGSLKISDEIVNNAMREILYNFPPLYNLDRDEIVKHKRAIASHLQVFSRTHAVAVKEEMTSFSILTPDRSMQRTSFGDALDIVANFSGQSRQIGADVIPAESLLIIFKKENKNEVYTPSKWINE